MQLLFELTTRLDITQKWHRQSESYPSSCRQLIETFRNSAFLLGSTIEKRCRFPQNYFNLTVCSFYTRSRSVGLILFRISVWLCFSCISISFFRFFYFSSSARVRARLCMHVCARVRACVRECVPPCVLVRACACVRVCVSVSVSMCFLDGICHDQFAGFQILL